VVTMLRLPCRLFLSIWILGAASISPSAAEAPPHPVDAVAIDLLAELERSTRAPGSTLPWQRPDVPRLAIVPFDPANSPLPGPATERLYDHLQNALIRAAEGRFRMQARESLRALIRDQTETHVMGPGDSEQLGALVKEAGTVDLLIVPRLVPDPGYGILLSAKAVDMEGGIAATTPERAVPMTDQEMGLRQAGRVEPMLRIAARILLEGAPDLTELRLGSITYQDSGYEARAGHFLLETATEALLTTGRNVLANRRIRVREAGLPPARSRGLVRSAVTTTDLDPATAADVAVPGSYVLSGVYWEHQESLDLRLVLRGADGTTVAWRGHVLRASLPPAAAVRPRSGTGDQRSLNGLGPFSFVLTTNKGNPATLRIGETMELNLRIGQDAWVYCFYRQADGATLQVFPNPYFWKRQKAPHLEGRLLHVIPDAATANFSFRVKPPEGEELIRCFALDRDVTAELPEALCGYSLAPLDKGLAERLRMVFQGLGDVAISEASIPITVMEPH